MVYVCMCWVWLGLGWFCWFVLLYLVYGCPTLGGVPSFPGSWVDEGVWAGGAYPPAVSVNAVTRVVPGGG